MGRGCHPRRSPARLQPDPRRRRSAGADVAIVDRRAARLPARFRGARSAADAKLIRVDVEPNHLERNRVADVDLVGDVKATLAALSDAAGLGLPRRLDRAARERGGREAGRRGRRSLRRPLAAASDAALRGARPGPRPRRDRDRRRRRLRLLRRPGDRHLRARHLDGPGPVRLPRRRTGAGDRRRLRASRAARSACCSATAPSASAASSSTRWSATACRSSA